MVEELQSLIDGALAGEVGQEDIAAALPLMQMQALSDTYAHRLHMEAMAERTATALERIAEVLERWNSLPT